MKALSKLLPLILASTLLVQGANAQNKVLRPVPLAQPSLQVQTVIKSIGTTSQWILKQQNQKKQSSPPPAYFAQAQKRLEVEIGHSTNATDKVALQNALTDLYLAWGLYWERHGHFICWKTGYDWKHGSAKKAISFFWRAYRRDRVLRPGKEFSDLTKIADNYSDDEKTARTTIWLYQQVINHYRKTGNTQRLAHNLYKQSLYYAGTSRPDETLRNCKEALALARQEVKPDNFNLRLKGLYLMQFAYAQVVVGGYEEAMQARSESIKCFHAAHDNANESWALREKGYLLAKLDHLPEALEYLKQAQKVGGHTLDDIGRDQSRDNFWALGYVYARLKQYPKALRLVTQARNAALRDKDKGSDSECLGALGEIYLEMHRYPEAIRYSQMAATRYRDYSMMEGRYVNIAAFCYLQQGRHQEAVRFLNRALRLNRDAKNNLEEAKSLGYLCILYARQKQPQTAIVYGKQAVNIIQTLRSSNERLDAASQRMLIETNRETYERLAALLVQENRLEEAEQVLRFLRQQDAFEFVQRDKDLTHDLAGLFQPLTYTLAEKKQLPPNTSVAATAVAGQGAQESQLWQQTLAKREEMGTDRAALLSTFNTQDAYYVILTTAQKRLAFSVPIKRAQFAHLAKRLQNALSTPRLDPKSDANAMERIVFCGGRLEKALQAEGITTALWFTSGALRYIPIDALYDGKQYLVQKPRLNVSVTLTSRRFFGNAKQGETLAAGVSQPQTLTSPLWGRATFSALVNVPKEVRAIVNDASQGGTGPFQGRILLDRNFNEAALKKDLAKRPAIVHIATHFSLGAGGSDNSFLVMGDGNSLPVSQWKKSLNLHDVGLLTLSGCETGVGSTDATGGEVSSIGEVSQWLGAQSIIVSLWSVDDTSTADLMRDFYTYWHANPATGKAQALREAQRALLGNGPSTTQADTTRGPIRERVPGFHTFVRDPAHPFAHPFYWAPFTLIGNWN